MKALADGNQRQSGAIAKFLYVHHPELNEAASKVVVNVTPELRPPAKTGLFCTNQVEVLVAVVPNTFRTLVEVAMPRTWNDSSPQLVAGPPNHAIWRASTLSSRHVAEALAHPLADSRLGAGTLCAEATAATRPQATMTRAVRTGPS
jgi:hypothetical protein